MIYPEIKHIHSPDLEPPELPEDPFDCEVAFQVMVGPKESEEAEAFGFVVVTPARLARVPGGVWGRGKLIVPSFEWAVVVQALARLLAHASRDTWGEVAQELNKELIWEFENREDA